MVALTSIQHSVHAQISLFPTAIFIRDDTGPGELTISNPSDADIMEVTIYPEFGYPAPDPEGNLVMVTRDTLMEATCSFASQLRIFPRSFLLQPRQQQVVRLQVRTDRSRPDQAYYTRIVVSSNTLSPGSGSDPGETGDEARVRYVFRQSIPAFFLKGKVNTGLSISSLETERENHRLLIRTELYISGNAPYLGSLTILLLNEENQVSAVHSQSVALYIPGKYSFGIETGSKNLQSGKKYNLKLQFETRRSDISPGDLIQSTPVTFTKPVELDW